MAVPTQPLTLGIEEEYQIIDPQTRDLRTYISELLTQDQIRAKKLDLKPELMQSQVEVGSHICRNIKEARAEIVRLRRDVLELSLIHIFRWKWVGNSILLKATRFS